MHEQIYYEHWDLGAHATIDAINMAALNFSKKKDVHSLNTFVYIYRAHVILQFMWRRVVGICYQRNTIILAMCLKKFTYEIIESNYPMPQLLHSE